MNAAWLEIKRSLKFSSLAEDHTARHAKVLTRDGLKERVGSWLIKTSQESKSRTKQEKKILQDRKDKVKKNQYLVLEGEIQR